MIKEIIIDAYVYAREKHKGQMRKWSNLEYFIHPKAVARMMEDLTHKDYMVAVALLHDTIEDTDATYEEILERFGKKIADLVMELTETPERRKGRKKVDYLKDEMRNYMSSDALTIKLADRLHNVKFLEKDITDKEHYGFIAYYIPYTKEILNYLRYNELTYVQKILYDQIMNVIKYVEIKHWKGEE